MEGSQTQNEAKSSSFFQRNRIIIRGAIIFGLLVIGSIVLLSSSIMQTGPVRIFTSIIAQIAGAILRLFDKNVNVVGTLVSSPRFQIEIVNGCNGVEVTAILASAILATPAPWRKRLAGIAIGAGLIFVLNIARAVSLFLIGSYASFEAFQFVHVYVWQTVVVLVSVAFFMVWLGVVSAERPGSGDESGGVPREDADTEHRGGTVLDNDGAAL